MTTVTNAFPDHLPADCRVAVTGIDFSAAKDEGPFLRDLFPFGMVYETLERAFTRYGVPADAASLPEKALYAPAAV